jgi:hypothetical protein
MKAILEVKESNFNTEDFFPKSFNATINGTNVLIIKLKGKDKSSKFFLDLKNLNFTEHGLLLEGIISNESSVLGRCVFYIRQWALIRALGDRDL